MSRGCPVVASNASSIPEVAGDAALLFDPASTDDIADKMLRAATDAQLRSALVEAGRRRCRLFSWDRCASETLDLYRHLRP